MKWCSTLVHKQNLWESSKSYWCVGSPQFPFNLSGFSMGMRWCKCCPLILMGSQGWEQPEKPYTITSPTFEEESQSPIVLETLSDAEFHVQWKCCRWFAPGSLMANYYSNCPIWHYNSMPWIKSGDWNLSTANVTLYRNSKQKKMFGLGRGNSDW